MSRKPAATLSVLSSIVDEVVNSFDLRSAFTATIPYAGRPDGDGGNDNNNEGGEGGDGGEGDKGDAGASGEGDANKPGDDIKDPEKKRLHDEAARYRNERNQLKAEKEELAKRVREQDDKEKTDLEKAQRDLAEEQKLRERVEAELMESKRDLSFYKSGIAAQFRDPADAMRFLDLKSIKVDDDGNVPEKDIKAAAEALLKQKPYLGRSEGDDDSGSGGDDGTPSGRQTNGPKKTKDEASRAALEKKFPALQGRG